MVERRHADRRAGKRKRPGERTFTTQISAKVSYGELRPEDLASDAPVVLHAAMVTRSELKVGEAAYFLAMLRKHLHNETAVLYHLDALLTSLRAVTFVLKNEGGKHPEFAAWYAAKEQEMKERGMRPLIDLRNTSEKEGLEPPSVEFVFEHLAYRDGRAGQRLAFERFMIAGSSIDSPIDFLEASLAYLRGLVAEAKRLNLIGPPEKEKSITVRARVLREQPDGSWAHDGPPKDWSLEIVGIQPREERGDLH